MAFLPPTFEARLARARALTPNVRELVFERVDGEPMAFEPGQWVSALFDGVKRSYSIASGPNGSPQFDVAVTRVPNGPASTRLHAIEPGEVVRFTGPQGFFTRTGPQSLAPALFIATGTGVTPMRSMLQATAARPAKVPIWLVLGVRREEDLLYADEFRALARQDPAVRFEPTLSQPRDGWTGRRGYVQSHVRALWAELAAAAGGEAGASLAPHAYVCGLERMVGSVRDLLRKEMGLPRQQVHSERYD
jgi:CDP-4-dehydro-6-deoxyglucose reductase